MKKSFAVFLLMFCLFSCSKTKKKEQESTTTKENASDILLKIDGSQLDCKDCSYSYRSGVLRGITFNLPNASNPMLLNFPFRPLPGVYVFKLPDNNYKNVTFSLKKDGTYFGAVTGTISVATCDTGSVGEITKMKATFSFRTDTINSKYYSVTDGTIDFVHR